MRNKSLLFLLAAGLVLSLTGCEKEPGDRTEKTNDVNFKVAMGSTPETKTAYTGEMEGSWERIDWKEGDPLLIWSDFAVERAGGTRHSANYVISKPIEEHTFQSGSHRNQSWSIIRDDENIGLIYDDAHEDGMFKFWSIYPVEAVKGTAPAGGDVANVNKVSFEISSQAVYDDITTATVEGIQKDTIQPNMFKAVMLAAAEGLDDGSDANGVYYYPTSGTTPGVAFNSDITFRYYPAFTAFEITLAALSTTDVELEKVELISGSDLAGTVTATVKEGVRDNNYAVYTSATATSDKTNAIGASDYEFAEAVKTISFDFPDDANSVSSTHQLTFTVFALPQNIEGLTLRFYTEDGDFIDAKLKSFGNDITFAACKKHRLYGLSLPDGTWHVYLESEVQEWKEAASTATYGDSGEDGIIISAGALEHISGAEGNWSRTAATLYSNDSVLNAYYSVYSPTNGKWRITMKGSGASYFTLESASANEDTDSASGDGDYIEGDVDQRVFFTLTPKSGASGKSVELWFTVVVGEGDDEVEYTLHSEVTRSSLPLTVTCP